MNQPKVIESLVVWLQNGLQDRSLEIRCDHVTEGRQELGLYIGQKQKGKGKGSRIAQPDILILDPKDRTVRLILEVDPVSAPKKLLGDILAVLLADNYTPSNHHYPDQYTIQNCVVIFLTELKGQAGSQKYPQFQLIEQTISSKLCLQKLGVKAVHLCFGNDDSAAVECCQKTIRDYFPIK